MIRWREELRLGEDMLDRHHRQMVEWCAVIGDRLGPSRQVPGERVADPFSQLLNVTAMHFSAEEDMMHRSGYPGRWDHQDRHHDFLIQMKTMETRLLRQGCPVTSTFVRRLENWVENHILGSDRGFCRYLAQRSSLSVHPFHWARSPQFAGSAQ